MSVIPVLKLCSPYTHNGSLLHRPGALIAGTWAAMQYLGSEYVFAESIDNHNHLLYLLSAVTSNHAVQSSAVRG